jgi:putative heme transporter
VAYGLAAPKPGRSAGTVVRYLLGVLLGIVVLVVLFGQRGELAAARHQLRHLDVRWLVAAVLAEGTSVAGFALLQRRVLRLAGCGIALPGLLALSLANDAIANTLPGGPAVAGAYRYRYYRQHGASGASAGWTVFTVLVAQAIGMSLLLLVAVLVAVLAPVATGTVTGIALVGLAVLVMALAVLIRRDLIVRFIGWVVRGSRRVFGHPSASAGARFEAALARMREIPLSTRSAASIAAIAAGVWACDLGCLLSSFGAVHAVVPWRGVLLAYGAAQVAGSLPVAPGGLGIVEGSLAVILVAYGAARIPAISAALAYRLVSFWLVIAVGSVSVAVIAYRTRRRNRSRTGCAADKSAAFQADLGDLDDLA